MFILEFFFDKPGALGKNPYRFYAFLFNHFLEISIFNRVYIEILKILNRYFFKQIKKKKINVNEKITFDDDGNVRIFDFFR